MALLRGNSVNAAVLQFPVFETCSNEVLSKNKLFHEKLSHRKRYIERMTMKLFSKTGRGITLSTFLYILTRQGIQSCD